MKCGCECEILNDDLLIKPSITYKPTDNKIRTDFDHRIAMSFAVMGSKIGKLFIEDAESINTSFPKFKKIFNESGGNLL
jgi:5-enolpyruvylshikimate-3-phosphate synthase